MVPLLPGQKRRNIQIPRMVQDSSLLHINMHHQRIERPEGAQVPVALL